MNYINNNNLNGITNTNKSTSTISKRRNKNKNKKKHKEINSYYVGTDSSRSGSTVLDLNEYYLNILESQQLVVNSKLNRINNYYPNEENDKNNDINDNDIKINNFLNDTELNEKINSTIKRANELLYQNRTQNYSNSRNEPQNQDDLINIQENQEIRITMLIINIPKKKKKKSRK